jgi:hypothetical protein
MASNLPQTLRLMKSQDHKIVFATRLIPLFPFDIMSILFGAFTFRRRSVFLATFLGVMPSTVFLTLMSQPDVTVLGRTMNAIGLIAGLILAPLLISEYLSRKRGKSLWATVKAAYEEILTEARLNNQIVKRNKQINPDGTPILWQLMKLSCTRVSVLCR